MGCRRPGVAGHCGRKGTDMIDRERAWPPALAQAASCGGGDRSAGRFRHTTVRPAVMPPSANRTRMCISSDAAACLHEVEVPILFNELLRCEVK